MAAVVNYWPTIGTSQSVFDSRSRALLNSIGASFTGYRYVPLGLYSAGVDIASRINNQTTMDGPGITSDATPVILANSNNCVQAPKTTPWFCSFRGKIAGAFAGANYAMVGLHDGTTDFVRFGYAGGFSNSFWMLDVGHGGADTSANSTIALDTNTHDHACYFNGSTTCTYYVDGVLAVTQATLTNFPTTPQSLMSMANTTTMVLTECVFAFNETT